MKLNLLKHGRNVRKFLSLKLKEPVFLSSSGAEWCLLAAFCKSHKVFFSKCAGSSRDQLEVHQGNLRKQQEQFSEACLIPV